MIVKMPANRLVVGGGYNFYGISEGSLGTYDSFGDVDWFHCREEFQSGFPRTDRVFFKAEKYKKVIAFIKRAEVMLKLPDRKRAKFFMTDEKDVIFIRLGEFWRKRCRRELFTILLRAGDSYSSRNRNFWVTALKHPYLKETEQAFRHFMAGNTTYKGRVFDGWVDTFSDSNGHYEGMHYVKDPVPLKRLVRCP